MNTKTFLCASILTLFLLPAGPARAVDAAEHDMVVRELAAVKADLAELKAMVASLQEAMAYCVAGKQQQSGAPAPLPQAFGAGQPSQAAYRAPGTSAATETDAENPSQPMEATPDAAPFSYNIVREWGRSPAQAAALGSDVSSLKGMVIVVTPGAAAETLDQLGRDLHTQYAAFENINIEVFDDADAAEAFAQSNVANPAHRVLSVSKHKASGRDVILRTLDGITLEIPY